MILEHTTREDSSGHSMEDTEVPRNLWLINTQMRTIGTEFALSSEDGLAVCDALCFVWATLLRDEEGGSAHQTRSHNFN
jgi:hypothetical protein